MAVAPMLDRAAQITSILRNAVSWIGPRPEATVLPNGVSAEVPFYVYRHIVRPGISSRRG